MAANVTNSVAVTPGYLGSVAGSRADLADLARRRNLVVLVPTAAIGGYVGARLARWLPPRWLRAFIVTAGRGVGVALLVRAFSAS